MVADAEAAEAIAAVTVQQAAVDAAVINYKK